MFVQNSNEMKSVKNIIARSRECSFNDNLKLITGSKSSSSTSFYWVFTQVLLLSMMCKLSLVTQYEMQNFSKKVNFPHCLAFYFIR